MKKTIFFLLIIILTGCVPFTDKSVPMNTPGPIASPVRIGTPASSAGSSSGDTSKIPTDSAIIGHILLYSTEGLYFANADGTVAVLIHSTAGPPMAALSPDGSKLAYLEGNNLYVQDIQTGINKKLNQEIIGSVGGKLKWSADAKTIALSCSTKRDPAASICLVNSTSGRIDVLVSPMTLEGGHPGHYLQLEDWSNDGSKIIFSYIAPSEKGGKQEFRIYLYNMDSGKYEIILDGNTQDLILQFRGAAISPNGTQLLLSGINSNSFRLFLLNLKNNSLRQLTQFPNYSVSVPVWGWSSSFFYARLEQTTPPFTASSIIMNLDGEVVQFLNTSGSVLGWVR